jgi:DNA-directed RNA polymerase specialized sigma subunit
LKPIHSGTGIRETEEYGFGTCQKKLVGKVSLDPEDCDSIMKIPLSSAEYFQDKKVARTHELYRLRAPCKALSGKDREILKMRYEQEILLKNMGEILGMRENTVTVQAKRCMDLLRGLSQEADERGAIS